jgi:phosphoribosyl 1,2-cyclic phosphodiesterase
VRVDSLASGSSGNAYLVRTEACSVLLEAGLPARQLVGLLRRHGLEPARLDGILLTHAHGDHAQGARELSATLGVPVYASEGTLYHRSLRESCLSETVVAEKAFGLGDLTITPFRVPHDCNEPFGFALEGPQGSVCFATDLGHVPGELLACFRRADLLILESNHDEEMLWRGPYPGFLKRRVAGDVGHLSNRAAADCLAALGPAGPTEVWLTHLSATNNRPALALASATSGLERGGAVEPIVRAVPRRGAGLSWRAGERSRQLVLF